MIKIALITNIPAPYREKLHELISEQLQGYYTVIYCAEKEANRDWKFNLGNYKKIFLSKFNKGHIHNNIKVWSEIKKINPDVVITNGFYPTMLYAFAWCMLYKRKHLVFTDGTLKSEQHLSKLHTLIRTYILKKTKAFIGTSNGSINLYESFGIKKEKIFRSYLCIDNDKFYSSSLEKKYHLMFSGQFIERKLPFFFIEVARIIKERTGNCKVLLIGGGPLEEKMTEKLKEYKIDYDYPGFIEQQQLPGYYSKSKLFLFPTKLDPWGVVANEAMAAGVPVITCENAGVADDLVISEKTGYVLPLKEDVWAEKIISILTQPQLYEQISANAKEHVQKYNFQNAAKGFIDAIRASAFK